MPVLTKKDFWYQNTNYLKTDRMQSLVSYNNELYLCIESHKSSDTFDNTKFTKVYAGNSNTNYNPITYNLDLEANPTYINVQVQDELLFNSYDDIIININSSTEINNSITIDFNNIDNTLFSVGKNYYIRINAFIDLNEGITLRYNHNNDSYYDYIFYLPALSSQNFIELVVTNAGFVDDKPKLKIINSYINELPS